MADAIPAFDDIPSFDDLPDAAAPATAQQSAAPVPAFDDIPDFDALPDQSSNGQAPAPRAAGPAPEGPLASGVREFAHSVIPGVAGAVAAPFGAAAGSVVPVAGTFAGGAAAFVGGSMAAEYAQQKALKAASNIPGLEWLDDDAQRAANAEANPNASFAGDLAGGLVTMSPEKVGADVGKELLKRGAGALAMGGFEAGGEALQGEDFDPTHIAMAAAAGAVFTGANPVGRQIEGATERFLPGRPGRTANPAADQAHIDVGDQSIETAVGDSVLAEGPPVRSADTTGNPASAPTNSRGEIATGKSDPTYAKATPPDENSQVTQGDMDPGTAAALQAANPEPAPAPQAATPPAAPQAPAPVPQPAAPAPPGNPNAGKRRIVARPRAPVEPVVDTGFPQAGEPVAVGENEATPMPPPAKAQAAIAMSNAARDAAHAKLLGSLPEETAPTASAETPPPIKGETVKNDTLSDAQKDAGNYLKARTHDFGKPIAIETHAGDMRRSPAGHPTPWENKSPYEYGYFNKTVGPDGDHIDFMRPADGAPELGDKHFIIDQKDATTGKYDEPKVMTYVKDEATARDLYNRGFSDNKGADRLHDITEVSRPELVKFLAKHSKNPPKSPYGAPMPKVAKPMAERAVVKDLIAKGKLTPEAVNALPPEQVAAAIAGKRTRKYGVETGASAGYPVEGLTTAEGKPVTANTKTKAAARAAVHKDVQDWFERTAPKGDVSKETPQELIKRLENAGSAVRGELQPFNGANGWQPTFKPKEWLLAREAMKLKAVPSKKAMDKFHEAERMLRGSDADVENYRGSNRIEADIANSRRSGDEAVAAAENKLHAPGTNAEEDAILESIDRGRRGEGKFDVPHEEAESMVKPQPVTGREGLKPLPRKTIDVRDSALAKLSVEKPNAAARKAEVAALVGKKSTASKAESEGAAGEGKSVLKSASAEDMKRLIELSNKAAGRKGLSDEEIAKQDLTKQAEVKPNDTPTYKRLVENFANDERGSLDWNKIKADLTNFATTPVKSYIARTPNPKLEPHADYTRGLSDQLHVISQLDKMHRQGLMEDARALPKEADRDAMERIYKAREADSAHTSIPGRITGKSNIESLSPADKKIYDDHLKKVFDENDKFYDAIHAIDPDRLGPKVEDHIARITKGDTSEYNMLKDKDDPTGPQYNGLSVNATMAHERPFTALERVSDGRRFVVQNRPEGGFTLWDKYKGTRIKDPSYGFEANQPYTVKGKTGNVDYIMRHATADEIEANARGRDGKGKPMKYYKNAALSGYMTNAQMGSMARHLTELARISSTPEFQSLTTRNSKTANERGWKESLLPNFKGTYMDPQLRYVMDDYAKPGFDSPQLLRDLNQSVTKLLFWMPTAHIANVGAHWFVGRGWDWIKPSGYRSLAVDGTRAIRSVMNQDAYQKKLMQAGAGTIYPSVATRGFIEKVAKSVGEEMIREPSKWGPVADTLGVPLKKLSDAIYNGSSKIMWAANDMFLTQRIMELERKGLSVDQAIKQTERDIPNYRLPTTIMTGKHSGRILQQIMADPMVASFGRYHYGMFNSYANIVKDALGKDATAGDRLDAIGKMMAMGLLAYGVYPVLDKVAKLATGNDEASQNRRGPLAIPSHIGKALRGEEDVMAAARSTMTVPPFWSTVFETLANKDWRGKPIVEPGDVRAAAHGDWKAGASAVGAEGEHALRGLVSPYSTFANAAKKGVNPAGAVRDQAMDLHNPSDASKKWLQKLPINEARDSRNRVKHGGSGPIEGGIDRLLGR